jgi:hypothetical protein
VPKIVAKEIADACGMDHVPAERALMREVINALALLPLFLTCHHHHHHPFLSTRSRGCLCSEPCHQHPRHLSLSAQQ